MDDDGQAELSERSKGGSHPYARQDFQPHDRLAFAHGHRLREPFARLAALRLLGHARRLRGQAAERKAVAYMGLAGTEACL